MVRPPTVAAENHQEGPTLMAPWNKDRKLDALMEIIFDDHPPERGTGMSVCVCGAVDYRLHLRKMIDNEGFLQDY